MQCCPSYLFFSLFLCVDHSPLPPPSLFCLSHFLFLSYLITYVFYSFFCPIDSMYALGFTFRCTLGSPFFFSPLFSPVSDSITTFDLYFPVHLCTSLFFFLDTTGTEYIIFLSSFLVTEALMVKRGAVDRWLADTPSPITTTTTITILLPLSFPNMYCSEPRRSLFYDIWGQREFERADIIRKWSSLLIFKWSKFQISRIKRKRWL